MVWPCMQLYEVKIKLEYTLSIYLNLRKWITLQGWYVTSQVNTDEKYPAKCLLWTQNRYTHSINVLMDQYKFDLALLLMNDHNFFK